MKTTLINHQQGSDAWHQHRARHLNASDCSAAMGLSSFKTRSQLLHEKATGFAPEIDAQTQTRFDRGHEFEAIARPWAEEIIESDLYPVVLAGELEGLNLSASLDGLTMMNDISFEHKTGRADLLASLEQGIIPDEYHPQMEMGLMLSGAEKCLFMASSGDKNAMRWAWYLPNLNLRAKIIGAWKQFAIDLAAYVPTETVAAPVGKSPETLPALHIEVTGMVTASNLAEYKAHALAVFDSINRDLVTDADFANAEKTVKWAGDVEDRLAAAKQHALSQTASIDQLFRTIDDISAEARRTRLELDKLVKARKDAVRDEILCDGKVALAKHIEALNARLGKPYMPAIAADFAAAIKGKRSIAGLQDAVDTTLANAKIEASTIADRIALNLRALDAHKDHAFLFADVAQLVLKAPDDLAAIVQNRIAAHQAKESARLESERARIAEEERAKAQAAERARADAEIAAAAATAAAQAQAAQKVLDETIAANALVQANIKQARYADAMPVQLLDELSNVANALEADSIAEHAIATASRKASTPPTLRLGQICTRLGFTMTADFLSVLGFEPAATDKAAKLFHESDFQPICAALVQHIRTVAHGVEA